jgi:hypothetical protein
VAYQASIPLRNQSQVRFTSILERNAINPLAKADTKRHVHRFSKKED